MPDFSRAEMGSELGQGPVKVTSHCVMYRRLEFRRQRDHQRGCVARPLGAAREPHSGRCHDSWFCQGSALAGSPFRPTIAESFFANSVISVTSVVMLFRIKTKAGASR
jgi:hypothetical protein